MKNAFLAALTAIASLATAPAWAAPFVYVTQARLNSIAVIDAASNSLVGSIALPGEPMALAIDPSGGTGYVALAFIGADGKGNAVGRLDLGARTVDKLLTAPGVPQAFAFDAGGHRLFVGTHSDTADPALWVVDVDAWRSTATLTLPSLPLSFALSPDASRLYVRTFDHAIGVVDTAALSFLPSLPNRNDVDASGLAINPAGTRVYVANGFYVSGFDPLPASDIVTVLDVSGSEPLKSIAVGSQAAGVTFDPLSGKAYISAYDHIAVIDSAHDTLQAPIPVPATVGSLAVEPVTRHLYVAAPYWTDQLSVIDPATGSVLSTLSISEPGLVAVAAAPNGAAAPIAVPTLSSRWRVLLGLAIGWLGARAARRRAAQSIRAG